jgi:CBS domain-containing protein
MSRKVITAAPETTVREAANLMRGHRVNCLPVVSGRRLRGVVTTLDLLELIGRGAERPVAKPQRRIMKDRGVRPQRMPSTEKAPRRNRQPARRG